MLLFAIAAAAATAILFGVAPALVATRVDVLPAIKSAAASAVSEPPGHRAWSSAFVIVQVAFSLVLVAGAALFLRTLANLRGESLGVDQDRVLVFSVDASQNGYAGAELVELYRRVLRAVQNVPGVESASAARLRLFAGTISLAPLSAAGAQPNASGSGVQWNAVGPGFAATLGIDRLAGRDLEWKDFEGAKRVALVNEEVARHFFGDIAVVGRRVNFGDRLNAGEEYEIVGVLSNAKYGGVRGRFPRVVYVPFTTVSGMLHGLSFQVRSAGAPLAVAPAVRDAIRRVEPRLAVVEMDAMPNQIDDSLWQERLFARLTTAFAATALLLSCMGIYGTIAYGVGRRRSEIALRMALGARRVQVLLTVLRRALLLALAGTLVGLPLTLWAGRFTSSLLFGLAPSDPLTIAAAALLLIGVAALAAYLPARRATEIDPVVALKQD